MRRVLDDYAATRFRDIRPDIPVPQGPQYLLLTPLVGAGGGRSVQPLWPGPQGEAVQPSKLTSSDACARESQGGSVGNRSVKPKHCEYVYAPGGWEVGMSC